MGKIDTYVDTLRSLNNWDEFLLSESGLPGPRANLELIDAVAEAGSEEQFIHLLSYDSRKDIADTADLFLILCGVVGLGKLVANGKKEYLDMLRSFASDERWRVREGAAIALQHYGDSDMNGLLNEMIQWSKGSLLEKRAVTAALCEPRLLSKQEDALSVLKILDNITQDLLSETNRREENFKVLRKTLGYGWSVAFVYNPDEGKKFMEKWFLSEDKDIRWIMKENLKKDRLMRKDQNWTEYWKRELGVK
jgi:hypothetical protein